MAIPSSYYDERTVGFRRLVVNNVDFGHDWAEDVYNNEFVHRSGIRVNERHIREFARDTYERELRTNPMYHGGPVQADLRHLAHMAQNYQGQYPSYGGGGGGCGGQLGQMAQAAQAQVPTPPWVADAVQGQTKEKKKNKKLLLIKRRKKNG